MNSISLVRLLFNLLFRPAIAWKNLAQEREENNVYFHRSYLYPVLGLVSLFSFIGGLIQVGEFDVTFALQILIVQLITCLGGYYVASVVISDFIFNKYLGKKDRVLSEQFVGYSSGWIYIACVILSFGEQYIPLSAISILALMVISEGAKYFLEIKKKDQITITLSSFLIILLSTGIIGILLNIIFRQFVIQ